MTSVTTILAQAAPDAGTAADNADTTEVVVTETPAPIVEAASSITEKVTAGEFDQITSGELLALGLPILKAVILIIAVLLVAKWAKGFVVKVSTKSRVEITLSKFFGNLAKWAILVLGGITILQTFGVEATSFAAVVAAVGFAVGMALSGTLGNVASGVLLLIFRPYKVGDVVSVGGNTGKVCEIELFTTTLDTPDNRRIIVPNGSIFGSTIENISHHPKRRVDINVGTAYNADIDKAREVLQKVADTVEGKLEGEDSVVYLKELGGSSIDWAIRVWSSSADYWAVRERLTRNAKYALDEAGIGIPFPQMDVHLFKQAD